MSDACNINTQLANEIADDPIKGELRKELKAYDMAFGMFKFLLSLAPHYSTRDLWHLVEWINFYGWFIQTLVLCTRHGFFLHRRVEYSSSSGAQKKKE